MIIVLQGMLLGLLLIAVCAFAIKDGAVGAVHLYNRDVQERCVVLGLTTHEKIKKRSRRFKAAMLPIYLAYLLVCVYVINGARGFAAGFVQTLVILEILNLIDRLVIDGLWVEKTSAWIIPGTEDLRPYIKPENKRTKWLIGTLGPVAFAALFAGAIGLVTPLLLK